MTAVVGFPERDAATYNSAAVLADGAVQAVYRKMLLPNYSVFDERRYFEPGDAPALIEINGVRARADDLRGHLVSGSAGLGRGARRRLPDRQPLGLPLSPRQGRRP